MKALTFGRIPAPCLAVLLLAVAAQTAAAAPPQETAPESRRLILKLTTDAMVARQESGPLSRLLSAYGAQALVPVFPKAESWATGDGRSEFDRVFVLELPETANMNQAVEEFAASPGVEYAEIDHIVSAAVVPNDSWFPEQWSLRNTGQNGCKPDADVDAPEAWQVTRGAASTIIAVIDSGIDLNHPDLSAKIVAGYDFVNNDHDPMDDHGHGTHVAGIAAARSNNGTGIAGICWGCTIMPLKVLRHTGLGEYSWMAAALVYAADHAAAVINMSITGTDDSITLHDAVRYAYRKNVPMVAATGNEGRGIPRFPAAYPEVIAVGSTECDDNRSSFSNYGNHLALVAPGAGILSTLWDDTYASWSGTSMATPHVAGVIGLMRSLRPSLSASLVRGILQSTADDEVGPRYDPPGWDSYFGNGRLNARAAVKYVGDGLPPFSVASRPEDGWVLESTAASGIGGTMQADAITIRVGDDAGNRQYRGILSFNTAGLPDDARIVFVTLKLKLHSATRAVSPFTSHGKLLVDAGREFIGAGPGLEPLDFEAIAAATATGSFSARPVSGWYSAPLTRTAIAQVNPLGRTQFRIRFAREDDQDFVADYAAFHSGNAVDAADRPKLIVQYYRP
ncbi:MAG TPA: S8 family serine peptidase [Candidatus Methanoperedens sp.]|nr:S8 family serine peptidase [Candidatus Methanoperedens sp.]